MSNKHRVLLIISIFMISTLLISACTQSLSNAPEATPTLISFVSPFPTAENPMAQIEEFAKQTAAAQTAEAGHGTPVTPQAITTTEAHTTPEAGTPAATTDPHAVGTPTNAAGGLTTPVVVTPAGTAAPFTPGPRPATYTLQAGEFPYCIARRYNVNPDALLAASGLTSPDLYSVGDKLTIPQSGAFPGDAALASHPTTYTVLSGNETLYSVACKFGNVYPEAIAAANGIAVSAKLTAGQKLQIP
jgi:LysM repeat protein